MYAKICKTRLPKIVIRMLLYVLTNKFVYVKFGSSSSDVWRMSNGVRQGGVWSTLLYNLYVKDLFDHVSDLDVDCRLGDYSTNILSYVDGLKVLLQNVSFGISEKKDLTLLSKKILI